MDHRGLQFVGQPGEYRRGRGRIQLNEQHGDGLRVFVADQRNEYFGFEPLGDFERGRACEFPRAGQRAA